MPHRRRRCGTLDILSTLERERILREWNDTARELPPASLPALFEAQVARTPDATALVFADTTLSYGELDVRANRLAHQLIACGIGPEDIVGHRTAALGWRWWWRCWLCSRAAQPICRSTPTILPSGSPSC